MIRTTRTFCLSAAFALATINFLSSSFALAQFYSLDSTSTQRPLALASYVGSAPTDPTSYRLPRSMVRGLYELQAYSLAGEVSLSIDVDDMLLTQCSAMFTVADPKDASWTLGDESRSRLSGLGSELEPWNLWVDTPMGEGGPDSMPASSKSGRQTSTSPLLSIVR